MFSKYIRYLLYNFELWGFCTAFPELRISQKWATFIFVAQIIYSCILCEFVWLFLHQPFYTEYDSLTVLNDVVKFWLAIFGHMCIIIESYCKRPVQQKFWQTYYLIRSNFNRPNCGPMFRIYFIRFVHFFISVTVVEIKHFMGRFSIFLSVSYFGLMTMHEMRIFYYLFCILLLDHQLDEVRAEMKLLADASEKGTLSRECLRQIRIYFDLVYELSNCINEVFGWSNIMNVLFLFLRFVFDLVWTYYSIVHRGWVASTYIIWLFLIILLIVYLFNATTKLVIKYQNIVYHFNRIEIDLDDDELLVQIECTSLQLMRQPIVLHAKGCFVIDYSTLLKLLGGITTYMVFYVQFSPKIDT